MSQKTPFSNRMFVDLADFIVKGEAFGSEFQFREAFDQLVSVFVLNSRISCVIHIH